jgi:peptidyl-tRNA hydrolase, PTH1 family
MGEIKMVVGLGNPGEEYAETRHNIGFKVVDALAKKFKASVNQKKFNSHFGMCEYDDKKLIMVKPLLYMNNSGQAVATAAGFYKVEAADILVILDDMDLECGKVRLRAKGSAGGHKGLIDILSKLGTEEINRLRVGIGRSGFGDTVNYVLGEPSAEEKKLLEQAIERAKDAAACWLDNGIEKTMNRFNQ